MFENVNANSFFSPDDGYMTTDIILTSYSLNPQVLNEVLVESGIITFYHDKIGELNKHVICCVQNNRYCASGYALSEFPYAQYLMEKESVRGRKEKESYSFHPKLWLFLQKNEQQKERIRLVISSRNLTKISMLESALVIEGEVDNNRKDQNSDLRSFLKEKCGIEEKENVIVKKLACTDFSQSIKRIAGENSTLSFLYNSDKSKLFECMQNDVNSASSITIVSPFLGNWEFISQLLPDKVDKCVITNSKVKSESISKENGGSVVVPDYFKAYKTDKQNNDLVDIEKADNSEGYSDVFLHSKLHAYDIVDKSVLYIGSANFSQNGLEKNCELMCRIESSSKKFSESLRNHFGSYLQSCEIDENPSEEEFDCCDIPKLNDDGLIIKQMESNIGKTQLTEIGRKLFGNVDADAPLDSIVKAIVRGEMDNLDPSGVTSILKMNYSADVNKLVEELKNTYESIQISRKQHRSNL